MIVIITILLRIDFTFYEQRKDINHALWYTARNKIVLKKILFYYIYFFRFIFIIIKLIFK